MNYTQQQFETFKQIKHSGLQHFNPSPLNIQQESVTKPMLGPKGKARITDGRYTGRKIMLVDKVQTKLGEYWEGNLMGAPIVSCTVLIREKDLTAVSSPPGEKARVNPDSVSSESWPTFQTHANGNTPVFSNTSF